MFRFKQFEIDQSACAMKINTDGVLLGALSGGEVPRTVLDIGSGTGVVALMLAQRFTDAMVDAVEVEEQAAGTSDLNFKASAFAHRMSLYPLSFQEFSKAYQEKKYDLIVSNPPFFLNSLKNPDKRKETARHTDIRFFEDLLSFAADHLESRGRLSLILPYSTAASFIKLAQIENLFPCEVINIKSFGWSEAHRVLISFCFSEKVPLERSFVIYEAEKQYSKEYIEALKDFFIIF